MNTTTRRATLATLLCLGGLAAAVALFSPALRADDPPLSPNGQAFVATLEGFSTLQTAVQITPWTRGKGTRKAGVLHLRSDGVMALDSGGRSRYAFDGTRFTSDAYDVSGGPRELWPEKVPYTNAIFSAIRNGLVTWTGNNPTDYGLEDATRMHIDDWAELHLPASVLTGYRVFFLLDGDRPSSLWIYTGGERVGMVVFRSWVVDPPLPPQAFSPDAPPIQVELWEDSMYDYTPH